MSMHVRRISARYHLPESRAAEKRRLDRILTDVLSESLEHALDLAGVDSREEVCIRRLHVPLTLRLSAHDDRLCADWSVALAEALSEAVRSAPRPVGETAGEQPIIRYRSRIHALIDMGVSIGRSDFRRAWAWKRMGLWAASEQPGDREAVAGWVATMEGERASIVPVLRSLALRALRGHKGAARLFGALGEPEWRRLALAAWAAAGGATELLRGVELSGAHEVATAAKRLVTYSPLGRALALYARRPEDAGARRVHGALVLLEREPGMVRVSARGRELLDSAADYLLAHSADPLEQAVDDSPARPTSPGTPPSGRPEANSPTRSAEDSQDGAVNEPEPLEREAASTRVGGLLFLLNVIRELNLADEFAGAMWRRRPFLWVVQQLGMVLSGAGENDPAVLAFCGLPPGAPHPAPEEPPATERERVALAELRERIADHVFERLNDPDVTSSSVLPFVCRREAEILADPGWIDVRLSLQDVSLPIRRAGLDLNPGYVEWLGVVVRFLYA